MRLVEARHELATSVPLGHVCALTFSAVGLVYCAFSDTDRIAAILVREMAQNRAVGRPNAPTSKAELERRLTTVRSAGLATVKEGDGGSAPFLRRCLILTDNCGLPSQCLAAQGVLIFLRRVQSLP